MPDPEVVPLVDLALQHQEIREEVRAGFDRVVETTGFIGGPEVAGFESEFAAFAGRRHCAAVGNGTDAIELALRALGIGPGDEVVLPANTFVATALAVFRAGATPRLVDVDPCHLLIEPEAVAERIGPETRAVCAVHLYGQIAPVERLASLAAEAGIELIEDAAQSHGAKRHGSSCGSHGAVAATSFYPAKNLGAYGDGGAVLTDRAELDGRVRRLRDYGSERKYEHPEIGFNSRLDALQAVVLRAKLARLAAWNEARRDAAVRYEALLDGIPGLRRPQTAPGNEHVWHLYVVRVPDRDRVLAGLQGRGIQAGVHYPRPLHLQGALASLGHRPGDFPVAERASAEVLSLPLFPGITPEQQERVARALLAELG
jgi:dTDP-4-amino-4,6-dideoxygalactose transaminase